MSARKSNPHSSTGGNGAEIRPDRKDTRRAKYAEVSGYADRARSDARERYGSAGRTIVPATPAIRGTLREVTHETIEDPVSVESFTIPELAQAIGKAELTVRRWIQADKLPAPYLVETVRQTKVYSLGEVNVILSVLQQNGQDFANYTGSNSSACLAMHEHMHAYRAHNI